MQSLREWKKRLETSDSVNWPSCPPSIEFFWHFEMRATREEIWNQLSDTSRLNREMGFTPREQVERDGKMHVTTVLLGFTQQWIEAPWTWIANSSLASSRIYQRGIAREMHSVFHIDEGRDANHRLVSIYFGWTPQNWVVGLFLKLTAKLLQNKFAQALSKMDAGIAKKETSAFLVPATPLTDISKEKINEIKNRLLAQNLNLAVIEPLLEMISQSDDLDVEPIRLRSFASKWNLEEREVLATFLHATRFGLLRISWDVICPHCRGSRSRANGLGEIPENANCAVCEIDFTTDHANSIEVLFHVHPSIRKVESLLYCVAEPSKKNHIKVQQSLNVGQNLKFEVNLPAGAYRVREVGEKWQIKLEVKPELPQSEIRISSALHSVVCGPRAIFHFQNDSKKLSLLVIEEIDWAKTLQPSQVLAMPEFRDLFAEEHLNSNVKLFLGEQTILFTDIVGSTKFYANEGDAKAFAKVRAHFQEVFEEVNSGKGVVVKTIGDSVMASFALTREAIQTAIRIQERFHPHRTDTSVRLRVSVHFGQVIAVHLNSGIDYFGNTVNFAAKIQSCASSGEIAFSEAAYQVYQQNEPAKQFQTEKRKNSRDGLDADVYILQVNSPVQKTA